MYDAIIIGAGMSGLAAGIRLAHFDKRVCILERHYTIGGLNSFYRLRGRDYDVGLHAVTNFTPKGTKKGRSRGCSNNCDFAGKILRSPHNVIHPSGFPRSNLNLPMAWSY